MVSEGVIEKQLASFTCLGGQDASLKSLTSLPHKQLVSGV
jgi:hypothetical protein